MSIIVAFLLASASAAPDQPTEAAPTAVPAPAAAKPAKEKQVCKTDPNADPGSHMVKRICHTQSEWDKGVLGSSRSGFSISGDKMEGH